MWGYGHLVVFASAAAVGAGLAVAADQAIGDAELSARGATLAVAIPVALYMLSDWVVLGRHKERTHVGLLSAPTAALLVLVAAVSTSSVLVVGVVVATTVTAFVIAEALVPADDVEPP